MPPKVTATATVKLKDVLSGKEAVEAAIGVGPVDATFKASSVAKQSVRN